MARLRSMQEEAKTVECVVLTLLQCSWSALVLSGLDFGVCVCVFWAGLALNGRLWRIKGPEGVCFAMNILLWL